jgi:hypothetical protein
LAARRAEVGRLNTACQELLAAQGRLGSERLRVEDPSWRWGAGSCAAVSVGESLVASWRPGKVVMNGVPLVAARRLPSMLRALPAVLGPERVASLTDQARIGFHAAA